MKLKKPKIIETWTENNGNRVNFLNEISLVQTTLTFAQRKQNADYATDKVNAKVSLWIFHVNLMCSQPPMHLIS